MLLELVPLIKHWQLQIGGQPDQTQTMESSLEKSPWADELLKLLYKDSPGLSPSFSAMYKVTFSFSNRRDPEQELW